MDAPLKRVVRRIIRSAQGVVNSFTTSEEELLVELKEYADIIRPHYKYFTELSEASQARFLQRVFLFKKKKRFHFQGMEPDPAIPILISACAVQITFGLRNYTMRYFRDIYVLPDAYTYGFSRQPWIGHVNRNGIHLSWKHFMHGISVVGDRYNVGLHEMAHALVYVNFLGWAGRDKQFAEQFLQYKQKTKSFIDGLRQSPGRLYTSQAAHNYHECWAESVELFFENPVELQQEYPEIYDLVKQLLNQDPAKKIKAGHAVLVPQPEHRP